MSDREMIETIAIAIAAARGVKGGHSNSDEDYATKFLTAYRAVIAIEMTER